MMSIFRKNMWNMFREASKTSAKVFYEASKTSAIEAARVSAGAGIVLGSVLAHDQLRRTYPVFFKDNTHNSPENDAKPSNYLNPK